MRFFGIGKKKFLIPGDFLRKIRGMYGAGGNFAERAECGTEDVFCRRGGKMLDFVSWLCLNNITMDKWAPAVAGAFFVYCRIGRASAL